MVVGNDAKHYQFQNKEIVSVNCAMMIGAPCEILANSVVSLRVLDWMRSCINLIIDWNRLEDDQNLGIFPCLS